MSKNKKASQISNQFFDEMQEKMQGNNVKRRKLNKDINSQPELLFLQFKPEGKEDFTSFSNKLYSKPSSSNSNKSSWKPPVKAYSDESTTILKTGNKYAEKPLLGKHITMKNKENSVCLENSNTTKTNSCEQSKSTDIFNIKYNHLSSILSDSHQNHPIESVVESPEAQNKKHNCDFAQKITAYESVHGFEDCENNVLCDKLVQSDTTSIESIPITNEIREEKVNVSCPQQTVASEKFFVDNTKEDLEIGLTRIFDSNTDETVLDNNIAETNIPKFYPDLQNNAVIEEEPYVNGQTDGRCTVSKLDSENSSIDSDDELTQINPFLTQRNGFEKVALGINNCKMLIEHAGSSSNISTNEKHLQLQPNPENDYEIKQEEYRYGKEKYGSFQFKELNHENDNPYFTNTDSTQRHFEEIAYKNIPEVSNGNDEYDNLTNQCVTGANKELDKVTTVEKCYNTNDEEEIHCNYDEHNQADEVELGRINAKLEKINSFTKIVESENNVKHDGENYKEGEDCDEILTQVNEMCESFKKENPFTKTDFIDMEQTHSNIQYDISSKKELFHSEIQFVETDKKKNTSVTEIEGNNKQFKDQEEIGFQENYELRQSKSLEDLFHDNEQSNKIDICEQIHYGTVNNYSKLGSNTDRVLNEISPKKIVREPLCDDRLSLSEYLLDDNEETHSSQKSPIPKSDLADLTNKKHKKQTLIIKENYGERVENNHSKGTPQLNTDNTKKEAIEKGTIPQIENNVQDDEYSCLMISNSQLLEIEQQYYETPIITESEPLESKIYASRKSDNCRETITIGTQTEGHNMQPIAPVQFNTHHQIPSVQIQWTKKMQETKRKLRDTIQEIERLNSILLKVRREIWPQRNIL